MFNLENYEIFELINIFAFLLGITFGAIAQKTQFCFSGSIKDYLLTNSTRRGASVIMAIITAVIVTAITTSYFNIDLSSTNYYKQDINYFAIIAGGVLFGIGMILADGCSSRHLIKFAQGDPYSLITILFIGIFAYAATKGILYQVIHPFIANETLIEISKLIENTQVNIFVVLVPLVIFLSLLTKKIKRVFSLVDGIVVGLLVTLGWYITAILGSESMEKAITAQSLSFVYPTGKTLEFFTFYEITELGFGVSLVSGVLIGAFVMSRFNKKYSFGCTSNLQRSKIKYNILGGSLMGIGGIMAIGCTVGQGLTGVSTLAFASLVAIVSIFSSGFITAKILAKKDQLPMCFIFEWADKR